ncbi:MAG: putative transposase, partial [Acetobacteraceae bacterium]|nr:putative transposase [Acetobacteraceae bacterium]
MSGTGQRDDTILGAIRLERWAASDWNDARNMLRIPGRLRRNPRLAISDAHEGLKAAVAKVLHATWQRCRVHTMRNLLAHAGRQGRGVAAAF